MFQQILVASDGKQAYEGGYATFCLEFLLVAWVVLADQPYSVTTFREQVLPIRLGLVSTCVVGPRADNMDQPLQTMCLGDRCLVLLATFGNIAEGVSSVLQDENVSFCCEDTH